MALTGREKQAALRKRRSALGLSEVRAIWATESDTRLIKAFAKTLKKPR